MGASPRRGQGEKNTSGAKKGGGVVSTGVSLVFFGWISFRLKEGFGKVWKPRLASTRFASGAHK